MNLDENCPHCQVPLENPDLVAKQRNYQCKSCKNNFRLEPGRGLCVMLGSAKVIDYALNALKQNPSTTAKELDRQLHVGRISVLSFDAPVIEIRREARLLKLGESAGLVLPLEHIPVLAELADLLEKRRKEGKKYAPKHDEPADKPVRTPE